MNWISLTLAASSLLAAGSHASPIPGSAAALAHSFHHDGVLGTSLDLTFVTPSPAAASRAEQVALTEIERLRRVLSTWDSTSEVSRLFADGALDHPSAELVDVLHQYSHWAARSGNAYSARTGQLAALWRSAAATGKIPDSATLARVAFVAVQPAWRFDSVSGRLVALTHDRVDLNSLGKGFIIDRVIAIIRDSVPDLRGALVNIGGDLHVWGRAPNGQAWRIAIANPKDHADNATPLAQLTLRDAAVSSSGDYERGFTVAGRHYSHIIDPRTGYPADSIIGVTVIAPGNAIANALATTLSVLSPQAGLALVATVPGAEALLVTAAGGVLQTPGFKAYEVTLPAHAAAPATIAATLAIDVTPTERSRHPPYVVVWITDTAGHQVRTLLFWGDKPKYQREMSRWWSVNRDSTQLIDAVTRATRPAGKYTLEWDGLDQKGVAAAPGPYVFWLEAAYEDGPHSAKNVTVSCGTAPATGTIPTAAAFTGATITCGPPAH